MIQMTQMYKLLTQEMTSYEDFKWELGVPHSALGTGTELCSPDLLHCYATPLQAILFNPIHSAIEHPRLFRVECSEVMGDGVRFGCKEQTLVEELELPVVTQDQRVAFAILCSLQAGGQPESWAQNWLSRTEAEKAAAAEASEAARAVRAIAGMVEKAAAEAARAAAIAGITLDFDDIFEEAKRRLK
jgi:hypothetical protein